MNTKTIRSANATIEVLSAGPSVVPKKLAVVALACGGAVDRLSKVSFPVMEMQMRGYGGSKLDNADVKKGARPQLTDYIGDVDAVIRDARLERTVLLGYSHGGYFATAYALANPHKVAALILIEPALFTSREDLLQRARLSQEGNNDEAMKNMLRYVQPDIGMNAERAAEHSALLLKNVNSDHTLANEFLVRADNPIPSNTLTHLTMPILLIGGTKSHASSTVTRLASVLPTASVWWIQGAEHTDLMDAKFSKQLEAVVSSFVGALD